MLKPALAFGLILMVLSFGWLVYRKTGEDKPERANAPALPNQNGEIEIPKFQSQEDNKNTGKENTPPEADSNRAVPKQLKKPGAAKQAPKRENKPELQPKKEIFVKTPPVELQASNNNKQRKNEIDDNGILRLPIRSGNRQPVYNEGKSRNINKKILGKSLAEIKLIYIEITGDKILGEKISEQIAAEIQKSDAFVVTTDRENADAALKIYVRHESDAETRDEASVAAIVRLVNVKGFVVYPNQKGVSGWKYVGTMAKLPQRIAGDLIKVRSSK